MTDARPARERRHGIRIPLPDQPAETRFFLVIAGWAALLGTIYWFVSYEVAGTALLAGLAVAAGAMTVWLTRGRRRRPGAPDRPAAAGITLDVDAAGEALDQEDRSGGGTDDGDRPFHDESGRIPEPTLAPFAFGLGVALVALGPVFGLAPVAVGLVALAWGASGWFSDARAELDATESEDAARSPDRDPRIE